MTSDKKTILKTLNILYAEDDSLTRENITRTLELFAHKVFSAQNGSEALELFNKNQIHIVILDYIMPIMDGNSVATFIREKDPKIPIFMLSSHTEKEKLLSAIKTGVTEYLEKPIDFEPLLSALLDAVGKIIDSGRLTTRLCENLNYNFVQKTISTEESCERVTKHEYLFLELLLSRPMSLVYKQEIEDEIFDGEVEYHSLRNLVYRLRKKIPADVIVTIKDLGYMFRPL